MLASPSVTAVVLASASDSDVQYSDLMAFNAHYCLWHGGLLLEQPTTSNSVAIALAVHLSLSLVR